ncbi:MAG: glycosyltransferase family 9 protein [Verrucomicrobiota bacterium]|nr:glycosyltransferase family 9 protein [Verrucomicrobiota bacterium]
MRKLILKNHLSPGDIVMLTAAVRDLHRNYPGEFITDVRTSCPDLWQHNPFLTPLDEQDESVEILECSYPLIDHSNQLPYHCIHGFIHFLNKSLGLSISPTAFGGDIHLTSQEKEWYSQVHEFTGCDIPFWIIAAGGKFDVTIKWWSTQRWQQVVDHFAGRIQFVQIGEFHHHHPKLRGVIDLRGRTNLRELVRLVYHSQGVLSPVTALMHLAAAVETKWTCGPRPAVIVAGGREPAHWEAYPNHQFLHTLGALTCCRNGGCWRDRVLPLHDGDERDSPQNLCLQPVQDLPRCMEMITPGLVIHSIEQFYSGGALDYLTPAQALAAASGVEKSSFNIHYDNQPLNIHNSRAALDQQISILSSYGGEHKGRGIVICGGGLTYFTSAWVSISILRKLGCQLPIELWHLADELSPRMRSLMKTLNVRCVDAGEVRKRHPVRRLGGWELKAYALVHSSFREILLLDADNVPVDDPSYLFSTPEFLETGAIFWPDFDKFRRTHLIWENFGMTQPAGPEFESGQIVIDKEKCWKPLLLALWINEHSDFFYRYIHGDKETFHLAFRKLGLPFSFIPHPIHALWGTMCQHDFSGKRIFQHRNGDKWNLFLLNQQIDDFLLEQECRKAVIELRELWDGNLSCYEKNTNDSPKEDRSHLIFLAGMISCPVRSELRVQTLASFAETDWGNPPWLSIDSADQGTPQSRQTHNCFELLSASIQNEWDYFLFLEDDLVFNKYLRWNLQNWKLLNERRPDFITLYNPTLKDLAWDAPNYAAVLDPSRVYGSQALLLSRRLVEYSLLNWDSVIGMQDMKLRSFAERLGKPLYRSCPSLVQHIGTKSAWGGRFHQASDFSGDWKRAVIAEASLISVRGEMNCPLLEPFPIVALPSRDATGCYNKR